MARRRLDVREAAEVLGTTVDAVRKRIARGSLESEKEDGTVYVWLDTGQPMAGQGLDGSGEAPLVEELRSRVRFVERQLEAERQAHAEARRLLAAALERIPPQLEAPQESPEGPSKKASGPPDRGTSPRPQEALRRAPRSRGGEGYLVGSRSVRGGRVKAQQRS